MDGIYLLNLLLPFFIMFYVVFTSLPDFAVSLLKCLFVASVTACLEFYNM
jgi:hypothetical protein